MSNSWRQVYTKLINFIAEHPEIRIEPSLVIMPESVRAEFYQLFGEVRAVWVKGKFLNLINEARLLSQNYLKSEEEVIQLLKLNSVSKSKPHQFFLQDPIDGMTRLLFDPLFDLLKGKVDAKTFEAMSLRKLEASFRTFYILGYQKWIAISLIKLLKADKLFQVNLRKLDKSERTIITSAASEEPVPYPVESAHLSFDHKPKTLFIVPDYIVHSTETNGYISVRAELESAIAIATNASEQKEWYPIDSLVSITPDLTLVYVADKPEELSIVADAKKICRPDLLISLHMQKDRFEEEELERVKSYHNSLKPRLGTYVVSKEAVPEHVLTEPEEGIQILPVGFDESKMAPIIGALKGWQSKGVIPIEII